MYTFVDCGIAPNEGVVGVGVDGVDGFVVMLGGLFAVVDIEVVAVSCVLLKCGEAVVEV